VGLPRNSSLIRIISNLINKKIMQNNQLFSQGRASHLKALKNELIRKTKQLLSNNKMPDKQKDEEIRKIENDYKKQKMDSLKNSY